MLDCMCSDKETEPYVSQWGSDVHAVVIHSADWALDSAQCVFHPLEAGNTAQQLELIHWSQTFWV